MVEKVATLGVGVDTSDVKRGKGELVGFGKAAGKTEKEVEGLTKSSGKLGKVAGGVTAKGLTAVTVAATAAIGALAGIGQAIGTISEFSSSVSRMEAISGAAGDELVRMRDIALDLGSTTEFSAMQAADGLAFLSMAGFDAAESIAAIPAVLDLATASGMGLAEAADTASNIMSGFGIAATDAASVADILAAASSRANTDVSQLGQAMSTVAPISAALDISLADTAAAIGVLSDAGIQGARAGTAMRGVLASLAGPTDVARGALQELGLTIADVNPETQELSVIMGRLGEAGLTTADAMTIFGREAASGALVLVDGAKRLGEFGRELENVDGAAADMADTMRDNLGGDIKGLQSAVSGLMIEMGDAGLTAILRGVVQVATDVARGFTVIVGRITAARKAVRDFLGVQSIQQQAQEAMANAIDNSTFAIGDQVNAANYLRDTLANGNIVSLDVAQAELAKAEARRADIQATIEQNAITARQGEVYQSILADIRVARDALRSTPVTDVDQFEVAEQHLVDMLNRQSEYNDQIAAGNQLSAEDAAHKAQVEANIAALREQIAGYNQSKEYSVDLSERIAKGVASINFRNALTGAQALSAQMNVSLHQAMQMMGMLGAAAQAAGDATNFDPRGGMVGTSNQDANASARASAQARLERLRSIMDKMQYNLPPAPTVPTSGGGGAAAENNELMRERDRILEGLKTDQDRFNEDVEQADRLLDAGVLTLDQYTEHLAQLKEELKQSEQTEFEKEIESLSKSLADAIVQGENLGDVFGNVVRQMASDLIASGIQGLLTDLVGSIGGGGGLFDGLFGGGGLSLSNFDSGGYTGDGGKFDPAGIVHKGEYVMSAEATRRLGVRNLEGMHQGALRGFASGGYVGAGPSVMPSPSAAPRQGGGVITLNLTSDPSVIVEIAENTTGAMIETNNQALNDGFARKVRQVNSDPRKR
ncbi:phage tail tape measure protein [Tateyamaria sp.]|uniref:phage tail tape measure protein n=1 Tax=Tateyamaria sp. TaxID=1929288 RepID=UPI003B21726F